MTENRSSNESFITSTRHGTMLAGEIRAKEAKQRAKEAQGDTTDPKVRVVDFNDVYDGEWFVDAEEDEELMDTMLQKHGFKRTKSDAKLMCPFCFSLLCDVCQQHETYHEQFRAMLVTSDVRVSKKNPKIVKNEDGVCSEIWHAFCRHCDTEVGSYDPLDEMYHFWDVLPSR